GVSLDGAGTTGNLVQGNFIGTDINGDGNVVGNALDGVLVTAVASNNSIGGPASGSGNLIAFNSRTGVRIESGTGNTILNHSIFSNGMGINLVGFPGPVPGTPPNHFQNFPVLTSVTSNVSTSTTIVGTLTSTPNTTFLVQFFANPTLDVAGLGEGKT